MKAGQVQTPAVLSKRFFQQEMTTREVADSLNAAKNWLKHEEEPLGFDARFEAEDIA